MFRKNFHIPVSAIFAFAFILLLLFHSSSAVTNYVTGYIVNGSDVSQVFAGVNVLAFNTLVA
jgi:hypothetical protein